MQEPGGHWPLSSVILSRLMREGWGKMRTPVWGHLFIALEREFPPGAPSVCHGGSERDTENRAASALLSMGSSETGQKAEAYSLHTTILEGPRARRPMAGSRHNQTCNPSVYKVCSWTHATNAGHRHEYMEIGR